MRKKYEAFDGKIFDCEHDCEQYELRLAWVRKGFNKYAGDCLYAFRFLVEQCNVSPSFAFFFAGAINKTSDRGFTSWLAEYSDDLIALGLRLKSASQYLNGLTSEDREKALSQVRHASRYEDLEINWEESIAKFVSEFGKDPDNPFMKAAMQHLCDDDGFREVLLKLQSLAEAEETED
jgi:hypothetical protein